MDIKEVLNGNIFKVWAKFIIASVVGVVLNTIYTMVDGIFIGQGVGEVGLAGVNIAWPAVTLCCRYRTYDRNWYKQHNCYLYGERRK